MTIITDICCQAPDISNITMSCSMEEGLLLLIPGATEPDKIDFFEPREKLFHELKTATQWEKALKLKRLET